MEAGQARLAGNTKREANSPDVKDLRRESEQLKQFWNRIPDEACQRVVEVALNYLHKSPQQLPWHMVDTEEYFISESSIYRILKAHVLVTSPAYHIVPAGVEFKHKTQRPMRSGKRISRI